MADADRSSRTPGDSATVAPRMGLAETAMVFGIFSLLLWLTVACRDSVAARLLWNSTDLWLVSQWHRLGSRANPGVRRRDGVAGAARANAERLAKEAETLSNRSWRRHLDDHWTSRDRDRVG